MAGIKYIYLYYIMPKDKVIRGCGTRLPGGIYAETDVSSDPENSLPLEDFILDPPIKSAQFQLPSRGVVLREVDGVHHIFDRVGSTHYKNVADFLEEVRKYGLSRRLPLSLDYSLLTKQSRIVLAHSRAWVDNFSRWPSWTCPQSKNIHRPGSTDECCAGIWWEDIEGGAPSVISETESTWSNPVSRPVSVTRTMPSFSYHGNPRPDDVAPKYEEALFLRLPVHRLVTVKSADESHRVNLDKAAKASIPVEEVSE